MIQNPPSLELLRHELRRRVCARCRWRPRHSEAVGPEVVRSCELDCPVFVHLPRLRNAAALTDPMLRSRELAMEGLIDQLCHSPPARSAPETGTIPQTGKCPLTAYRRTVIAAVLDLVGRS